MTKITGKPIGYPDGTPLKLLIREDIPYRSPEVGVSAGTYTGTWNGTDWGVDVAMPRFDQPDAIPLGGVSIFITRTDTGAVVAKYNYAVQEWIETSAGVFDLSKAGASRSWVRVQQFDDLTDAVSAGMEQIDAASSQALAAAEDARLRTENLGGIRQIAVTDFYVELLDTTGTRLTPSTYTLPNGVVLDTITIEGVN